MASTSFLILSILSYQVGLIHRVASCTPNLSSRLVYVDVGHTEKLQMPD